MRADVFREVRERVSARDAAERYGLRLDRSGRALCPFHDDHRPSISFKGGRFRCWSCGAHGDAVDITAKLLGLDPSGAVARLNEDFGLGLAIDRPPTAAERAAAAKRTEIDEAHRAFERWREDALLRLTRLCRDAHLALLHCTDLDALTDYEAGCIRQLAYAEYVIDLLNGTAEEQAAVYMGRGRYTWMGQTSSGSIPQAH